MPVWFQDIPYHSALDEEKRENNVNFRNILAGIPQGDIVLDRNL